jgi:hypothetical protein
MSLTAISPDLAEIWTAALVDAGVDASDAVLYPFAGKQSSTGYVARTWARGALVTEPGDVAAFGDNLAVANNKQARGLRRVAVWTDWPPEALAGLIRHELEHSLQFDADSHGMFEDDLQELYHQAMVALYKSALALGMPTSETNGVIGGGELYNQIPMEVDANAAASWFVRSRFGDKRIDLLVQNDNAHVALFRRSRMPEPVATIRARMEEFVSHGAARAARQFAAKHRAE